MIDLIFLVLFLRMCFWGARKGILGALMIVGSALGAVSHQINGCAILAEGLMNHLLVRSTVVTKKTKGGEP